MSHATGDGGYAIARHHGMEPAYHRGDAEAQADAKDFLYK